MKNRQAVVLFVVSLCFLTILLQGCGMFASSTTETKRQRCINYASEHADSLLDCVDTLYEECSEVLNSTLIVFPLDGSLVAVSYPNSSRVQKVFEDKTIHKLFETEVFETIKVSAERIEFVYETGGLANSTSCYEVSFLRSGNPKDLLGYDSDMVFCEEDDGILGTDQYENRLFYCKISNQLYYSEVHY